jgi:hypothetical protein
MRLVLGMFNISSALTEVSWGHKRRPADSTNLGSHDCKTTNIAVARERRGPVITLFSA